VGFAEKGPRGEVFVFSLFSTGTSLIPDLARFFSFPVHCCCSLYCPSSTLYVLPVLASVTVVTKPLNNNN